MKFRPISYTRLIFRRLFTKKKIIFGGSLLLVILIGAPIVTYARFSQDISDRETLMNKRRTGILIRDRNGEILYSYGKINGYPELSLEEISDDFEHALLASEDQGFYGHEGFSIKGIARALYGNILNKDPVLYGGSTITQQLVKNKLLGSSQNYYRKYQEVAMAVAVEREYTKKEIMEMYLNSVYFGEGAFGIAAAADTYFDKPAVELNLAESSMLVGLLPAPSEFSPVSGDKNMAEKGQDRVLMRMVEAGNINKNEGKKADEQKLSYANAENETSQDIGQHFLSMVLKELRDTYGEEEIIRAGYDVTTSLDKKWQKKAEGIIKKHVERTKQHGANNASLVAIDPKNGQIRALVGSVDWDDPKYGKVNMAITPRQPGSSFKPIYYTEALDKKIVTAATVLKDEPVKFGTYEPQNFDFRFRGNIPLRHALAQSLNIPSIKVMQKLGVENASEAATRLGLSTVDNPEKYGLSLALGTAEVKVTEMTNAYATFANGGKKSDITMITSIENKYDKKVFEATPDQEQVISPEASFLISSILSDGQARAPTFGQVLDVGQKKVAVKTGTTDDSIDAWTMGFTPDVSVGVWFGNNRHKPMQGLFSSTSAGAAWKESLDFFSKDQHGHQVFSPTDRIVIKEVCSIPNIKTLISSSKYNEFFIKGTNPDDKCASKPKPKPKNDDKPKRREDYDDKPSQEEKPKPPPKNEPIGGGTSEPPPPADDPDPPDSPEDGDGEDETSGSRQGTP